MNRLNTLTMLVLMSLTSGPLAAVEDRSTGNSLIIVGSDTLSGLMTAWTERFYSQNPGISVEVQAVGSAAAPPALEQGTANIGTMSRPMNSDEREAFMTRSGREPLEIVLAEDSVVLIVHPSNPINAMTDEEVAQVFGMPGACGTSGRISKWSELRNQHPLGDRRLEVIGRTATSGTYQYFRRVALCNGDPGVFVNEIPGSGGIVNTVARLPTGIAYSAATYVSPDVKVLNVVSRTGQVLSPRAPGYPFKRLLYMYVTTDIAREPDSVECQFLKFIASDRETVLLEEAGFEVPTSTRVLTLKEAAHGC